MFEGIANLEITVPERDFDLGVEERDALTVDPMASLERSASVLARKDAIVAAEATFVRGCGARLIVADIPFLAGDVAEAAEVEAVGVGNFTWDWIYDAYASPRTSELVAAVRASYRKMRTLYQLPLGHEVTSFREVVPVPL